MWGRHVATSQVVQGAYSAALSNGADDVENEFKAVLDQVLYIDSQLGTYSYSH